MGSCHVRCKSLPTAVTDGLKLRVFGGSKMILYLLLAIPFIVGLYFFIKGMYERDDTSMMAGLLFMLVIVTAIIAS